MRHDAKVLNLWPPAKSQGLSQSTHNRDGEIAAAAAEQALAEIQPTLGDEVLSIHEYERQRMGQELHDSAGQLLVSLQLSVARLRAIEKDCAHEGLLEEIQGTVRQIDQEIRALAFLHFPAELGERGLLGALQSLVTGFGKRTGIRTSFKTSGDRPEVDEAVSISILRITQEALVNIHRHSHASSAKVTLDSDGKDVHLSVCDDGIGILAADASSGRGIGMLGMRHRVQKHGGHFQVKSLKHGTKISATMPLVA